jgi:hypothetical protein
MAKVIKVKKKKPKRIEHKACGATVEYTDDEVTSKREDEPYGGGRDTYHYLLCPNCEKMIRWC